jgi:predicted nucleotidyltransferase
LSDHSFIYTIEVSLLTKRGDNTIIETVSASMKMRKDKHSRLSNDTVVKRLRGLNLQLNREFGVSGIGIFGSYSGREAQKGDDIDLLVEFQRPVNLFEFSRLKSYLSSQLDIPVDLVTPPALKPLIKEEILKSVSYI